MPRDELTVLLLKLYLVIQTAPSDDPRTLGLITRYQKEINQRLDAETADIDRRADAANLTG